MTANHEPTREQLVEWLDRQCAIADEAVGRMRKAEARATALEAALREVLDAHRQPWKHGIDIHIVDATTYAAHRARLDSALVGEEGQ